MFPTFGEPVQIVCGAALAFGLWSGGVGETSRVVSLSCPHNEFLSRKRRRKHHLTITWSEIIILELI